METLFWFAWVCDVCASPHIQHTLFISPAHTVCTHSILSDEDSVIELSDEDSITLQIKTLLFTLPPRLYAAQYAVKFKLLMNFQKCLYYKIYNQ